MNPRQTRFDESKKHKLADEQVAEIRALYAAGQTTQRAIAQRFGIHQVAVSRIVLRKTRRRPRVAFVDRFWSRVDKNGPVHPVLGTACWVWTGGKFRAGYGKVAAAGKSRKAHRVSWELAYGAPPDDTRFVCHHCDNPSCVRPDHLFVGTAADNSNDRDAKGRTARGERTGMHTHPEKRCMGSRSASAKLNEESAREVVRRYAAGETQRALAAEYGVSDSAIQFVVRGRTWRTAVDNQPEAALRVSCERSKGYRTRGVKNPNAKLAQSVADQIRAAYKVGDLSLAQLGRVYGVSRSTVHKIVRGRTWNYGANDSAIGPHAVVIDLRHVDHADGEVTVA